jgi:hypothetical protein
VVDPDPVVLGPGTRLIIPECVQAASIAAGAYGIGKTEMTQRAEFLPRTWQK